MLTPYEHTSNSRLFISHSSKDDDFVRELRQALIDLGQNVWIDSRQLRGGDPLWSEIQKAIEEASAYAVVVSSDGLQSDWVSDELEYAIEVQKRRGPKEYPTIPLLLNGTKLGAFKKHFGSERMHIAVTSDAGGIEAAMNAILVALGKRDNADVPAIPQPKAEPLEELVLELTDLKFHEQDGVRRASARARLVYEPATPGQREVTSTNSWRLIAPIGPIEAGELSWYLEKYAIWPSRYFRDRARKVEENLVNWGRLLHNAAMPIAHTANVMNAWARINGSAGRRFSVHVDATLESGVADANTQAAAEAATLFLGLPWELLHDGDGFLFQGAKPTRVRRRLPNTKVLDVPAVAAPIRILLVTARPEDKACCYIDHRASALPLVEAMEELPGLVKIHVLSPPTLPALREALDHARRDGKPYHVVHFDGHGVYDRSVGLGGLCFEHPEDIGKLENRRHFTVNTDELGPLLRAFRIPLVFLEACQTAQAEKASESVASALLEAGVASVVAMSHSVLVETARRFVEAFYAALARGARVGDAMLEGQRRLKDDTVRGHVFGEGDFRLEDWFVPVLFQEKDDPQLFKKTPANQTREDFKTALNARLGELPQVPETGFIGRSRELLALQRLLNEERYAVIRGQGGEGKTALAAEFARWMVRSHQVQRAAFVSVETHGNVRAVVDALGRQLVGDNFSAAGDLEEAILKTERELRERETLLVIDNMESVLLPPFIADEMPTALSEEAQRELGAILQLCARLNAKGETRIIFTSLEWLPAPFDAARHRRELHQFDREDAVKLVERVLNAEGGGASTSNARRDEIEDLVEAVNRHARTLALLAPALRERGVEQTHASLVELMAEMERKFPGSREKSVFASVELSLRRMSPANRNRAQVLGVFHGVVDLDALRALKQWEESDVHSLALELIETGLATPDPFNHLTLNPALCPYMRGQMDTAECKALTAQWIEVMCDYARFLVEHRDQNAEIGATLTLLELPNLFALLELMQRAGDAKATINLTTRLYRLLQMLGKARLLERVGKVRDDAVAKLEGEDEEWNNARFAATQILIEQQLTGGQLKSALDGAEKLLQRALMAGEQAYVDANYDMAMAYNLLGQVLQVAGKSEQALPLLSEACQRFEIIAAASPDVSAQRMAVICVARQGDCFLDLGRLDEAKAAYEENNRRAEQVGLARQVAAGKGQLGTVLMQQRRYSEALVAYTEARKRFTQLGEPKSVAVVWHQIGLLHQVADEPDAAEDAYRKSLRIEVQLGNVAGQASTIGQLGNLYANYFSRPEEAVAFQRQAADKYAEIGDLAGEGRQRSNLSNTLRKIRRFDEARQEIHRAIRCKAQFGHVAQLWKSWMVLAEIETDVGKPAAAVEARRKAISSYLNYRRDGGENQSADGRIAVGVTQSLLIGDSTAAASILQQHTARFEAAGISSYIPALQAIVAGSRDRSLADGPNLGYSMAAEILLLIETLEQAGI